MILKKWRRCALNAIFATLFLVVGTQAHASGAIEADVLPTSLGAPTTTYPNAFSGAGVGIQADYFFDNTPLGVTAGFFTEGKGTYQSLCVRYYLMGHPQFAAPSSLENVQVESRSRGLFVEAGFAPYQITSTPVSGTTVTTSGVGIVGGVGLEQPFVWGTFLGLHVDMLSSAGSTPSFSVTLIGVSLGIPISF